MKIALRIILFPIMFTARLMLCITAFITSIAGSVIGLTTSLFALLSVIEFAIGHWKNGIAYAVLALLVSPFGLPGLANLLLEGIHRMLSFFEGLLT